MINILELLEKELSNLNEQNEELHSRLSFSIEETAYWKEHANQYKKDLQEISQDFMKYKTTKKQR
jgi:hypothetical protein